MSRSRARARKRVCCGNQYAKPISFQSIPSPQPAVNPALQKSRVLSKISTRARKSWGILYAFALICFTDDLATS